MQYGYLRETSKEANELKPDPDFGEKYHVGHSGLNEYLREIFPDVKEESWVHDKMLGLMPNGKVVRTRPDYRCEELKLIVEFDGLPHYQKPDVILDDKEKTKKYWSYGYTVVRIPYFIQLTRDAVKKLFGVDVGHEMFNPDIPSLGPGSRCTPAYLCPEGIKRMARAFRHFPDQYKVNINALHDYNKEHPDETILTGVEVLERAYEESEDDQWF